MIKENITTILIGGQAGDGAREAGIILGRLLNRIGQEVFVSADYPSLIKGGHNFSRISFSQEKVNSDYQTIDLLVSLNQETTFFHRKELKKDGLVFSDLSLPMTSYAKEINAPAITRVSVALGAICYYFDFGLEKLNKVFKETFRKKAGPNIKLAKKGYQHLEKINFEKSKILKRRKKSFSTKTTAGKKEKVLIDGNQAFACGLVKAGLDVYIAYPMTPASSILHFLAKKQKEFKLKVVQPENEISVINMALGSAYAGKRTAIGTSGGGFALMQEAMSLAGMSEIPLVVAESQRPGPANGVPTYTAQADLDLVRHTGHGEFPRIVLAPGDPSEAYLAGVEALNLAWKYQVPVIVLLDKHLSESSSTDFLHAGKVKVIQGKMSKYGRNYQRYQITADGISPLCFPGTKNAVIKATSYEHDEKGITIEDAETTKLMQEKRFRKLEIIIKEQREKETIKIYGNKKSKNIILGWGSTKGAVLEAMKYLKKPVKFIQCLWLEPLDSKKIEKYLKGAKKIIDVECNFTGQLASLIREKTGIAIKNKIFKYDARPFDPIELAKKINKIL